MEKQVFTVPNISCSHCVMTIKNELSEMNGIVSVEGDPVSKQVTVTWNAPATRNAIIALLQDINYPAA